MRIDWQRLAGVSYCKNMVTRNGFNLSLISFIGDASWANAFASLRRANALQVKGLPPEVVSNRNSHQPSAAECIRVGDCTSVSTRQLDLDCNIRLPARRHQMASCPSLCWRRSSSLALDAGTALSILACCRFSRLVFDRHSH